MTPLSLVLKSLRFYWRTHLGVALGCAVSAAVLVGALFVGDSVRASLVRIALARLGGIHVALDTGNRYFGDDLSARVAGEAGAPMSSLLRIKGMAIRDSAGGGKRKQVNRVEVLGVDSGFLELAESPLPIELGSDRIVINEKLAAALGADTGDEIALRMFKPGLLSRDAPLSSREEEDTARRLFTVAAILSDAELGRFSLRSDQASPYNAFVDRTWLQETLKFEGRANVMVGGKASLKTVQEALEKTWAIEDAGLSVRTLAEHGVSQLESPRIYLDPRVSDLALEAFPGSAGALYYLVDEVSTANGKKTPYSFMSAVAPSSDRSISPVPEDMKDDEILLSRWLADHLSVGKGDTVFVAYSEQTPGNRYVDRKRSFKVHSIAEMDALKGEKDLVPEFPGLTDVDSCQDWKIGKPMDEKKLNDESNEAYWKKYNKTPKAFVSLAAGRAMWSSRYGDLMGVRYPLASIDAAGIRKALRGRIEPAKIGLEIRPVREQALRAATESMDLGQLFLGMSMFLIAASLILTAMLFIFSVEQRAREMGVLMAVGHTLGSVRRLFIFEACFITALGSAAGIPLGWLFAKFLLWGLTGAWSGAVADTSINFHASAGSAAAGLVAAWVMSLLAVAVALWRQARRPIRELVAEDFSLSLEKRKPGGKTWLRKVVFGASLAGAAVIVVATLASGARNPVQGFFGAGALMLVAGVAFIRMMLGRLSTETAAGITAGRLGVRNAARRPGRGMATAGMLACGCFIVFSVSAMKEDLSLTVGERASGTGGFPVYGETSIAVHEDLNTASGRDAFRMTDDELLRDVAFVPVKVRDGDDASCLNLNLSHTPPLLGVDPAAFSERGAFDADAAALWGLLNEPLPDGVVPALVGDSATAMWKLKKSVGRESGALLEYRDERGEKFNVKLVGQLPQRLTVFQGRLLISNEHFIRLYPSESGYRMLLADAPGGSEEKLIDYLAAKLETVGLDAVPAVDRLREFYVVESTYLMMFLVLGGMGLLLGTAGMGILVLRNVMERRSELALLRAVGYSETQAGEVVMAEHRFLLVAGLVTGTAAALMAVGPAAARPEIHVPYGLLFGFLAGTVVLSLAWIWVAARMALRTPLVPALRNE